MTRGSLCTVESFGKDSGYGRFSDAPCTGKQVRMSHPFRCNGIHECLHNVRLSDHVIKCAGSIFSRGDLVIHLILMLPLRVFRLNCKTYEYRETIMWDALCHIRRSGAR